jgi:hypothetical protein
MPLPYVVHVSMEWCILISPVGHTRTLTILPTPTTTITKTKKKGGGMATTFVTTHITATETTTVDAVLPTATVTQYINAQSCNSGLQWANFVNDQGDNEEGPYQ